MANRPVGLVTAPEYNEDTFDIGDVKWSARRIASSGWLLADGSAVSRTTYSDLFAAIAPSLGAVTVTIASPGVFTLANHGLAVGDSIFLTTTGALPTGLSPNTLYYVVSVPSSSTFQVSAIRGGTAINTSGSQSGTNTLWFCPFGLGDGSTTFNLPDGLGRTLVGNAGSVAGAAAVSGLGNNEGVANNLRNISHRHQESGGGGSGSTQQIAAALAATSGLYPNYTSGDGNNQDGPARLVLNLFVKYA